MVALQAIGIDMASGRNCMSQFINVRLRLPTKDVEEIWFVTNVNVSNPNNNTPQL